MTSNKCQTQSGKSKIYSSRFSSRFEKQRIIVRMLCFEKKNSERLMDYTVMSLTNPHTIRCRPTRKYVERFRNESFHEFCSLKAQITLKEVNTSNVEKRKQNFNDSIKNNKQMVINFTVLFNSLILFLFYSQTRSSVPVASKLMNSLMEK